MTGSSYNVVNMANGDVNSSINDVELMHSLSGLHIDNGPSGTMARDVPPITTLAVTAHGISLYPEINEQFYNAYLP